MLNKSFKMSFNSYIFFDTEQDLLQLIISLCIKYKGFV